MAEEDDIREEPKDMDPALQTEETGGNTPEKSDLQDKEATEITPTEKETKTSDVSVDVLPKVKWKRCAIKKHASSLFYKDNSHSVSTGLTGWADAARYESLEISLYANLLILLLPVSGTSKHKPAQHGNVQYSHARSG